MNMFLAVGGPSALTKPTAKKVLIMDARSYTAAVANRAKGGGCECPGKNHSCGSWCAYVCNYCYNFVIL